MNKKKALRINIKEIKRSFSREVALAQSEQIFSIIEKQNYFIEANTVLLYWSMTDEVHTHAFAEKWFSKKTILLPVVNGDTLDIKQFSGTSQMIPGEQFGIMEPQGSIYTDYSNIDLIIVPGVAFDKNNNRMGRGRGYYDRLLKLANATKVGVCFDFQFFDTVPVETHDIAMDAVIHG